MAKYYKYMVEFNLPLYSMEARDLIQSQTMMVEKLFDKGVLITYTLAANRTKLWAVIQANNESELLTYIESFPISKYSDYNYNEIMFHDSNQFIPSISLN